MHAKLSPRIEVHFVFSFKSISEAYQYCVSQHEDPVVCHAQIFTVVFSGLCNKEEKGLSKF